MTATVWIIALLSLALPGDYRLDGSTSKTIPLPGPPGYHSTEEFRSWHAPGGKSLYLFLWSPRPPRDLGPMKTEREWPAMVAGQAVTIRETSLFMGKKQRVLVAHLPLEKAGAQAMIYATGLEPEEFRDILSHAGLVAPADR